VSGQQREGHRQVALGEVLGPGEQGLGAAGEAVAEEDADLPALVAERLGSGEDRHVGLLFGQWAGTSMTVSVGAGASADGPRPSIAVFTVRDGTDTDQGRRPLPRRSGIWSDRQEREAVGCSTAR
jgi:hypothetical protein